MISVERQVHWLVRAWPYPDRTERGKEIVSTTLDVVPDGRHWLPLAVTLNLLLGGFQARWRARPPLWRWFYYQMGGRLPLRWHRWMINDLMGPGWRFRMVRVRAIFTLTSLWLTFLILNATLHVPAYADNPAFSNRLLLFGLTFGVANALGISMTAKRVRNRILDRHGYLQPDQRYLSRQA